MLTPISRQAIFRSSAFADNFMAEMQQSYAADFDVSIKKEAAAVKKYYDHLRPFQPIGSPINSFCVLAYNAENLSDFILNTPLVSQAFLEQLHIQELCLIDFTKYSLLDFPFENFRKRNQFKRLGGIKDDAVAYKFPVNRLPQVLPLFFFARKWDIPVIFLLTADGEIPLSFRMCDNGNFHLNYQEIYQERIQEAAKRAGFIMGDIELCYEYKWDLLDKK